MRQRELKPLIQSLEKDPTLPHHPESLTLWHRMQDGILPFEGGWLDQPAWFIADMNYISLLLEYESLPKKLASTTKKIQDLARNVSK